MRYITIPLLCVLFFICAICAKNPKECYDKECEKSQLIIKILALYSSSITTTISADPFEPNDDLNSAKCLDKTSFQKGELELSISPNDKEDFFIVHVLQNLSYDFAVSPIADSKNTCGMSITGIYNEKKEKIFSRNADQYILKLLYTFPNTSFFYIGVSGGSVCSYKLKIEGDLQPCPK